MKPEILELCLVDSTVMSYVADLESGSEIEAFIFETEAPQGVPAVATQAYVVWQIIAGNPDSCMRGGVAGMEQLVQVTSWGPSPDVAYNLGVAVMKALDVPNGGSCTGYQGQIRDPDTKLWGEIYEFTFWVQA